MIKIPSTLCALFVATSHFIWANGFYIPVQAPEATSKGNAFVATADTASAVYYNAAGLSQIDGHLAQAGIYTVRLGLDAETDANYSVDRTWQAIPQIYMASRLSEKIVLGLGVNSPFGLSTDWGQDTSFSTIATETEILYGTLWGVGSYQISDTLSVGAGFGLSYVDGLLSNSIGFIPGDQFSFEGNDAGFNWTASVLWQPNKKHSFGAVYRSRTDFNLKGKAEQFPFTPVENASLNFLTPSTIAFGYSYRPNANWNFEINIEHVNWDDLTVLTLRKGTGDISIPFFWEDNFIYSFGLTRQLANNYYLNLGYNYIENSQPDSTFNPAVSDANRHWFTIGTGKKYEKWSWDLAYQYAYSSRDVGTSAPLSVQGEYRAQIHSVSLSAKYQF